MSGNTSRTRKAALRIEPQSDDDWQVSSDVPGLGDEVRTVEGTATVVRVLGKVSDGSRLLELKVVGRDGPSYFAATSNVLQRTGAVEEEGS